MAKKVKITKSTPVKKYLVERLMKEVMWHDTAEAAIAHARRMNKFELGLYDVVAWEKGIGQRILWGAEEAGLLT